MPMFVEAAAFREPNVSLRQRAGLLANPRTNILPHPYVTGVSFRPISMAILWQYRNRPSPTRQSWDQARPNACRYPPGAPAPEIMAPACRKAKPRWTCKRGQTKRPDQNAAGAVLSASFRVLGKKDALPRAATATPAQPAKERNQISPSSQNASGRVCRPSIKATSAGQQRSHPWRWRSTHNPLSVLSVEPSAESSGISCAQVGTT